MKNSTQTTKKDRICGLYQSYQVHCAGRQEALFGNAFNASFVCSPQIVLCLLVGEITFAPDLPQPQCGKVFRRIPVLRLLLSGFFVQHPLHHAAVFGAAYALLPAGTIIAFFPCSQISFLVPVLVVAGVCQYFSLWTKIDICFRIIGECFRLEPLCIGWRIIWLPWLIPPQRSQKQERRDPLQSFPQSLAGRFHGSLWC